MKRKLSMWVLIVLAVTAAFAVTGCLTTETGSVRTETEFTNSGNFGEHVRTPVKDFESMGVVFTENRIVTGGGETDKNQVFTYQELLKKAQALGADAIINVVIDKKVEVTSTAANSVTTSRVTTTTWYGSALAIKYTTLLTGTENITITSGSAITSKETTSVYFNDGGAPATVSEIPVSPITIQPPPAPAVPATTPPKGIRQ